MSASWKDRKGTVALLLVLAAVVWGWNVYLVASGLASEDELAAPLPTAAGRVAPTASSASWDDAVRDPFERVRPTRPSAPGQRAAQERGAQEGGAAPVPFPYRLLGVVDGTAMLELAGGGPTWMARRGATREVGGQEARVVRVGEGEVVVRYGGRTLTLTLE